MINASFGLENFTYNNTSVLEVLFGYLEKTQFRGITVMYIIVDDIQIEPIIFALYLGGRHV